MTQEAWSIDLCRDFTRIAIVDAGEFAGVQRWLEPGEWSLEVAPSGVSSWQPTGGLDAYGQKAYYGPQDVDTIRVVRGDKIVFAGFVDPVSDGVGGFEIIDDGSARRWRWAGPDLWHVLTSRVAFPNPATLPPWTSAYDQRTGVASTALAGYLYDNAGGGALLERRWPGFVIQDNPAGLNTSWSARLEPLDVLAKRICEAGGIGCWLELDWNGTITCTLGAARNVSTRLVVSDQSDLVDVKLRRVPPQITWTVAGGQGEGTARTFAVYATAAAGSDRREVFSDQSSLTTAAELAASAKANTLLADATWVAAAQVTDDLAARLRYGDDVRLGDTIGIEISNVRYAVPVTSAQFEVSGALQVVRPVLGTAAPNELAGLIRDVAGLSRRFNTGIA